MKWPTKLNIQGKTFDITYPDDMFGVSPEGGEHSIGCSYYTGQWIRVWNGASDELKLDALIHEILHMIFCGHCALKDILRDSEKETEENFIQTMASVLADTLLRNGLINEDSDSQTD